MSIDIEAIKGRIANGIYGDDRLTGAEVLDALAALDALVAEVERLRGLLRNLWHFEDPADWDDKFAADVTAACKAGGDWSGGRFIG